MDATAFPVSPSRGPLVCWEVPAPVDEGLVAVAVLSCQLDGSGEARPCERACSQRFSCEPERRRESKIWEQAHPRDAKHQKSYSFPQMRVERRTEFCFFVPVAASIAKDQVSTPFSEHSLEFEALLALRHRTCFPRGTRDDYPYHALLRLVLGLFWWVYASAPQDNLVCSLLQSFYPLQILLSVHGSPALTAFHAQT